MAKGILIHIEDEFYDELKRSGATLKTLLELGLDAYLRHIGPPIPKDIIVDSETATRTVA